MFDGGTDEGVLKSCVGLGWGIRVQMRVCEGPINRAIPCRLFLVVKDPPRDAGCRPFYRREEAAEDRYVVAAEVRAG